MALRGSVCIYQGEELGLAEAEIPFDLIQDPYGKVFWPDFKGRDGCRTPMAWDADKPNAGFSSANRTWLPVAAEHPLSAAIRGREENPETLLEDYRLFIRLRQEHAALRIGSIAILDAPNDILAFMRHAGGETILCVFNFALEKVDWKLPEGFQVRSLAEAGAQIKDRRISFEGNGAIYLTVTKGN
jgi:alpha-glucosidase